MTNHEEEIVAELSDLLSDCIEPWEELIDAITRLLNLDSDDDLEEAREMLYGLVPETLPYHYVEDKVRGYFERWSSTMQDPAQMAMYPLEVILGEQLKRSRLTVGSAMALLVETGSAAEPSGVTMPRCRGRFVENAIAALEERGFWREPAPSCGLSFAPGAEDRMRRGITSCAKSHTDVDYSELDHLGFCEHPYSGIIQDAVFGVSSAIGEPYENAVEEFAALHFDEVFGAGVFMLPPKNVLLEAVCQYTDALDKSEEGSPASRSVPYAKKSYDFEEDFWIGDFSLVMDPDLWADLCNREYYAIYTELLAEYDVEL